jgi:hypothetical protein
MEIKLLNSKQYRQLTGFTRTTLWRRIKNGTIIALKVSSKKLWFLPPEYEVNKTHE